MDDEYTLEVKITQISSDEKTKKEILFSTLSGMFEENIDSFRQNVLKALSEL